MLRLLAKGEAVHPVDDPEHLLRRLGPDGRLLVLAHPALPDVPIVQLWGAFYRGLPHTLASLQERASPDSASDAEADTLVLYSISSCRPSVSGGGLGQQLIKVRGRTAAPYR